MTRTLRAGKCRVECSGEGSRVGRVRHHRVGPPGPGDGSFSMAVPPMLDPYPPLVCGCSASAHSRDDSQVNFCVRQVEVAALEN